MNIDEDEGRRRRKRK